ncbi:MAG: hypothetical protein ACRDRS_02050 [Pseudonocardiaceae bacterium]
MPVVDVGADALDAPVFGAGEPCGPLLDASFAEPPCGLVQQLEHEGEFVRRGLIDREESHGHIPNR